MDADDGCHRSIKDLEERVREDGHHSVTPHEGGDVAEEGLDGVGQHGVEGGGEQDSLLRQQSADHQQDVVHTQTHEWVVEADIQVLI